MANTMTKEQFDTIIKEIETLKRTQISKSDVFQAVLTVQGFTAAIIVGCVVVLNSLGAFS